MTEPPPRHDPDPDHLAPDSTNASITFDDHGHLRGVDADVPGSASGSGSLHWEPGGSGHPAPADPGWMPKPPDTSDPFDLSKLPPPEGTHWDPITHTPVYDVPTDLPEEPAPGDYPEPDPNEGYA